MRYGCPRTGRGRRGPVALCGALVALALGCPIAVAQLPEVDKIVPGGAVGDVVGEVANEPLPQPLEDAVESSPVAPVREEVRRVVDDVSGGDPNSGGGSQSPAAGAAQEGSTSSGRETRAGSAPAGTNGGAGGRGDGSRRERGAGSDGRDAGPGGGAAGGDAASGTGIRAPGRAGAGGPREPADDDRNAVTRAIETIVEVVPTFIWIALGALLAIAAGLGARTFVERRRARVLQAEREQLQSEVDLLERALLPPVPERLGALAASVAYRPAEGPAAGGDFYDAFELPGGRATLILGDVSGHGPDALERTNSIRTGLHACLEAGLSPRAALNSVARRMASEDGDFATVAVAVHDPAAGTITYATAGHPPPILTGPSAHEPITSPSAPPLGVGVRSGTRGTTVPLPSGSIACFFTDGLLEARAGDEVFGRERLAGIVAALEPDDQAADVLERVIAAADEASDDMAVFVIRPVSGAEIRSARSEELELDADDLDRGLGERFLEACSVPAGDAAAAMEEVRTAIATAGGAVIQATVDSGGASLQVTPAPDAVEPSAPV